MNLLPDWSAHAPVNGAFAPAERFLLRLVPLAGEVPAAEQLALVLEELSPFPPAQLYWGYWVAPTRDRALLYAAYRRRFTAEETQVWDAADLVVPDVLALAGLAPNAPTIQVLARGQSLVGIAWDGRSAAPAAALAREFPAPPTDGQREPFVAELAARAGLGGCPATFIAGNPSVRREARHLVFSLAGQTAALRVPPSDQEALDVRDRSVVVRRCEERRRSERMWRLLLAGGIAAAAALLLDAGALGTRWLAARQQAQVERQGPLVGKLEAAQSLAGKVDELSHRRLKFFEMLEAINQARPRSIQFTRAGTGAPGRLDLEGRTERPQDVAAYEAALRKLPALEKVEVQGLRARDGQTVFGLLVSFKAGEPLSPGGTP